MINMADAIVDANEYLMEYLASIDNLSPEINHLFSEVESKDKQVEDLRKNMKNLQKRLWNMMDGVSSEDESGEGDEDDEDEPRFSIKRRRIDSLNEDIKKYTEQELVQKIRDGYAKAIQLSDEKCEIVAKALNLVKRHTKRMEDDFVALFPHHSLPSAAANLPNVNTANAALIQAIATNPMSNLGQVHAEFDSLSRRSPSLESEDSQFSLPFLPNPQNGGSLTTLGLRGRKSGSNLGRKRGSRTPTYTNTNNNNNTQKGIKFRITTEDYQFGTSDNSSHQTFSDFTGLEFVPTTEDTGYTEDVISTSSFVGMSGLEPTYCICNQVSFGEMIGCDGENCRYEWFHIGCVGLEKVPKGKWFCDTCAKTNIPAPPVKKRKRGRPVGSTKSHITTNEEFLQEEITGLGGHVSSAVESELLVGSNSQSSSNSESDSSSVAESPASSPLPVPANSNFTL